MSIHFIQSLDHPLLAAYRNMKDKELAREGGRFIAEGEQVVRRLLKSTIGVESVLVSERKRAAIEPLVRDGVAMLVTSDDVIHQIIGFEFHSGVIACGLRPRSPRVDEIVPAAGERALLTVCQEINNTENMGALIRVSAALGADAMILGERCCDPFFRQSVRVSMGSAFSLPIVRSENLLSDLDQLSQLGVERLAAVVGQDARPLDESQFGRRVAVVFGSEAQGLDAETIAHCSLRVTIPMRRGTDSLNVAVAAAIILYQLSMD